MKLIHCADLHLDSKMQTNLTPQKARERKLELLDTFERMVDYARANEVAGIIIAGDMFDTSFVSHQTKTRVLNTIARHPKINFYYLCGNHDEANFISILKSESLPQNLKIFGKTWQTFDQDGVKITGRILDDGAQGTPNLAPNDLNIVVLHGTIGAEINLIELKGQNIDYLALGHLHTYNCETLDDRGVYCYSGCLEGRGFDECGAKGFVLLDIDQESKKIQHEFVPFARRQIVEINCNITGIKNWFIIEDMIAQKLSTIGTENLVKITLTGHYDLQLEKQTEMLAKKFSNYYYLKVNDESVLDLDEKNFEKDISLRGEFIRRVLASNLTANEKERTILIGLKALMGEKL